MFSISSEEFGDPPGYRLEDEEREEAVQLIDSLVSFAGEPDAAAISAALRHTLHHEFFAYAQLSANEAGILGLVNIDFPLGEIQRYGIVSGSRDCLLATAWYARREPICVDAQGRALAEPRWAHAVASHSGRIPLIYHAQLDPTGGRGIGFLFGDIPASELLKDGKLVRYATPYLYAQLSRRFWAPVPSSAARLLTAREIQVIEWMYYGKTNEEIATLMGNSVFTVKNHVQRILLKLSAINRTQAVLIAAAAGLVKYSDASGTKTD